MSRTANTKKHMTPGNGGNHMQFYEAVRVKIQQIIKDEFDNNETKFANAIKFPQNKLNRFLNDKGIMKGDALAELLDKTGGRALWPSDIKDMDKSLTFAPPVVTQSSDADSVEADDYRAIPLTASEVAAGPGLVPNDEIEGWCLLWRDIPALFGRTNLIASRVGKHQRSMEPLIHPHDYIVVDRDDKQIPDANRGNIFLIRDPDEGVTIKRVSIKRQGKDFSLLLIPENREYAPDLISLVEYDNDPSRVLIGKVVYSWSSMLNK